MIPGKPYYQVLEGTPFGSELLWQFAKTAITEERLGQSGTRDLLCLSFSSNDIIGHAFGPDSQEVLDVTLRSDADANGVLTRGNAAVKTDWNEF